MSPNTRHQLRVLKSPPLSTQVETRSWRPCRSRPVPLIRSTIWLKVVRNMQQKLQALWPDAGDLDALGKNSYKGKKGGGAKGFGGKGQAKRDQTVLSTETAGIAVYLVTGNLNVLGLQQGEAAEPRQGRQEQRCWQGGSGLRATVKVINEITWDSSYDGVASSSLGSTDLWGDCRVNSSQWPMMFQ